MGKRRDEPLKLPMALPMVEVLSQWLMIRDGGRLLAHVHTQAVYVPAIRVLMVRHIANRNSFYGAKVPAAERTALVFADQAEATREAIARADKWRDRVEEAVVATARQRGAKGALASP